MSFFKVNHNEATSFGPIPEGNYECFISEVEVKTFGSGNQGLSLTYTIRNDVDQEGKKRKVFENAPVLEATMFKFQNLAKATSLPDGASFNSAEEMLHGFKKHLKGKPIQITIVHDNTREKFIEQVAGVAPSQVAVTGASAANTPFGAGLTPPPSAPVTLPPSPPSKPANDPTKDPFYEPGLQGMTPPPTQDSQQIPPWAQ